MSRTRCPPVGFLCELANLPPGAWRAEHLEGLSAVLRNALDAADLPAVATGAVGNLLGGLLSLRA